MNTVNGPSNGQNKGPTKKRGNVWTHTKNEKSKLIVVIRVQHSPSKIQVWCILCLFLELTFALNEFCLQNCVYSGVRPLEPGHSEIQASYFTCECIESIDQFGISDNWMGHHGNEEWKYDW